MAELKKCPFCGGEAEVVKVHSGVAMFPYTVVCKSNECSASVGVFKETREKAIEAWNNRATEAEIRAMAIKKFAEKIRDWQKEVYQNDRYVGELDFLFKHIYEIAEQLKEE